MVHGLEFRGTLHPTLHPAAHARRRTLNLHVHFYKLKCGSGNRFQPRFEQILSHGRALVPPEFGILGIGVRVSRLWAVLLRIQRLNAAEYVSRDVNRDVNPQTSGEYHAISTTHPTFKIQAPRPSTLNPEPSSLDPEPETFIQVSTGVRALTALTDLTPPPSPLPPPPSAHLAQPPSAEGKT